MVRGLDEAGWLGAVGGATALALAGVLALAALVAGLAAASSLAIVFAFTGVLCRRGILTGAQQTSLGNSGLGRVGVGGGFGRNRRSTDQAGERCGQQESIQLVLHFDLVWGWCGWNPRVLALRVRQGCRLPAFSVTTLGVGPYAKSYRVSPRVVYENLARSSTA